MGLCIRDLCLVGAAGLMAAACTAQQPQVIGDHPTSTTIAVRLDDPLRDACRDFEMPDPKFAFDSAELDAGSKAMLLGFATCLNGPLQPAVVRLVGQADPRGSEDYNLDLGLKRARAVKAALVEHGVSADRILISSIGEGAASAQRPWYDDRKVSVRTDGAEAPAQVGWITIYGESPQGGVLVFEEREDIDGDGADEPALYFKARSGERTRLPTFTEQGDVDGDGVDEPRGRG